VNNRYLIAGPCAAESEQQVLDTARGIALCHEQYAAYTTIFRAGIWKPRTSPDTFQGVGDIGLTWLQQVQKQYHLPVATEVANTVQVQAAVKAGMDYLWIGARTAANPIAVQEIAAAVKAESAASLKGICIKNPVHEDAALWVGNIARLETTGIPIIAVHRGCNHRPCWNMVYELSKQRPDIPVIIDPSHLSGAADQVASLCVKALELGYRGAMIETHIRPDKALSDAKQQITPEQLSAILQQLMPIDQQTAQPTDLTWLRAMMDEVDDDLWENMAKRMEISRRIGAWKKQNHVSVVQPSRFQQIVRERQAWAKAHGLDEQTVAQVMEAIHKESVRVQS